MRHCDFERIRNEFVNYYKDETKGEKQYYDWLHALHLDETLCYSQTRESFQWAKENIKAYKEDSENKYYKVLAAFPIESMNGNVYSERDLIPAALRIANPQAHPSMNHNDEYWLSPENPRNKWNGSIDVIGSKFEEGAAEAIIKVPKSMQMPIPGFHSRMTDAFDYGDIVNVSLEGFNANYNDGFRFNEKIPFTLLTKDVLPGIPLARVFPIEAFLPFSKSSTYHGRTIKIIGLEKMTKEKYDSVEACMADGNSKEDCMKIMQIADEKPKEAAADIAVTGPTPAPNPIHINSKPDQSAQSQGGSFSMPDNGNVKTVLGENMAQLKVDKLKAEQDLSTERKQREDAQRSFELHRAETAMELQKAYTKISNLEGIISTHEGTIGKLEGQIVNLNKEKVADAAEVKSLTRRLEDMTDSRDAYKKDFEALKESKEKLEAKYRDTLTVNLALEKKLTETNEEYLKEAKALEAAQDKIKHVNRITKITAKF